MSEITCPRCHSLILGRSSKVAGRPYHPECAVTERKIRKRGYHKGL